MQRPTLNTAKSLIFHDDHSAAPASSGPTTPGAGLLTTSGTSNTGGANNGGTSGTKTPGFQPTLNANGDESNPFEAPFEVVAAAPPPLDQSRQPAPDSAQQSLVDQAAPVGGLQSDTDAGRKAGHVIPAVNSDAKEYYGTEVHSRARTYSTVRRHHPLKDPWRHILSFRLSAALRTPLIGQLSHQLPTAHHPSHLSAS